MSVVDDIAAVEADGTKSPSEKKALIYALKTGALLPYLQQRIGQTWAKGAYSITLDNALEITTAGVSEIAIWATVTRNGAVVGPRFGWPLIVRDPPVGDGSAAQLAAWARSILEDNLR